MDELNLQTSQNIRGSALLPAGTRYFPVLFLTGYLLQALPFSKIQVTQAADFFIRRCLILPWPTTCKAKHFDMDFGCSLFQGSFQKRESKVLLEAAYQLLKVFATDSSELLCFVPESCLLRCSFSFTASLRGSLSSSQVHSC